MGGANKTEMDRVVYTGIIHREYRLVLVLQEEGKISTNCAISAHKMTEDANIHLCFPNRIQQNYC